MLGAFWQTFAGKIGEQFSARVLSPALVFLAGGLLADAVGTTTTLLVFAGWQALVAAATLSARSLRHAVV